MLDVTTSPPEPTGSTSRGAWAESAWHPVRVALGAMTSTGLRLDDLRTLASRGREVRSAPHHTKDPER